MSKRPLWALLPEHGARCAAQTTGERDATNDHNESIAVAANRSKASAPNTSPSMTVGLTDLAFSCKARTPRVRGRRPRALDVHKVAEVEGPRTRPCIGARHGPCQLQRLVRPLQTFSQTPLNEPAVQDHRCAAILGPRGDPIAATSVARPAARECSYASRGMAMQTSLTPAPAWRRKVPPRGRGKGVEHLDAARALDSSWRQTRSSTGPNGRTYTARANGASAPFDKRCRSHRNAPFGPSFTSTGPAARRSRTARETRPTVTRGQSRSRRTIRMRLDPTRRLR